MRFSGNSDVHLICIVVLSVMMVSIIVQPIVPVGIVVPYLSNLSMLTYWLHNDGISTTALLWTYFSTDYSVAKWKRRRKNDLHCRRKFLSLVRSSHLHPPAAPSSTPDWDSLPPPTYDLHSHVHFLSQSFDRHCFLCPDFLDILTFDPIADDDTTFCGLLDHTSVGVYMFDNSNEALVFDTGASVSITNELSDFVSWDAESDVPKLQGITTQAVVRGFGTVRWTVRDDNGRSHDIETDAYYVPAAKIRLLSPQRYLRQRKVGSFVLQPNQTTFYFDSKSPLSFTSLNKQNVGLPITSLHRRRNTAWLEAAQLGADVLEPSNSNLTSSQKELLDWHYRLAHFNLSWIQ